MKVRVTERRGGGSPDSWLCPLHCLFPGPFGPPGFPPCASWAHWASLTWLFNTELPSPRQTPSQPEQLPAAPGAQPSSTAFSDRSTAHPTRPTLHPWKAVHSAAGLEPASGSKPLLCWRRIGQHQAGSGITLSPCLRTGGERLLLSQGGGESKWLSRWSAHRCPATQEHLPG